MSNDERIEVIAECLRSMDYAFEDHERDKPGVWEAYLEMAKAVYLTLRDAGYVIEPR